MSSPITIGTASASPGEKAWGTLTVEEAGYTATLPVCIVHGSQPGHRLVALANQHGREINGVEALRRFGEAADPTAMSGSVILFPSANPLAAMSAMPVFVERELTPEEAADPYHTDLNMNYNWPGGRGTTLVAAILHEIWTQGIVHPDWRATMVVDVHCHQNPTAVYAQNEQVSRLGVLAGIENVIITGEGTTKCCNRACSPAGIVSMTVELGGQEAIVPTSVDHGVTLLRNLATFYGIQQGDYALPAEARILNPWRDDIFKDQTFDHPSYMISTASHDGLVVPHKLLYEMVEKGDLLCEILDPHTATIVEQCHAPMSGGIYGYRLPTGGLAKAGEKVLITAIAEVVEPQQVVATMDRDDYLAPEPF